ncbi:MAG: acyl-CoA thioesterase, partial [Rhodoferax sp.]
MSDNSSTPAPAHAGDPPLVELPTDKELVLKVIPLPADC